VRDTCLSRPTADWDMMMGKDGMMPGMMGDMKPGMKPGMDGMKPDDDYNYEDGSMDLVNPNMTDMMPGMDMLPGMPLDDMMPGMMEVMMKEMMGSMMGMMDIMKGSMMMGPDMAPVLSNITCIMQEMKWMDKNQMPNPKGIKKMIKSFNLNPLLTMNMCKEIDTCAMQSMCSMDMDSAFGPKIAQMMNFMKCAGYKLFGACAMNEMMMKMPMGPVADGPLDDATMMAHMAAHMAEQGQQDPEEMEKEGTFMMIMQTMFGPMSPFMQ